jgi:hypothetical protein
MKRFALFPTKRLALFPMKRFALFGALGAIAVFAACSNGSESDTGCSRTTASLPVLLYPAPNSVGISPALQFVAVDNLGGSGGYVQLDPGGGQTILTGAPFTLASPLPLPSPAASAPASAVIYSSLVPSGEFISGATYSVEFVHNTQPPCGPQQPSGVIGEFTIAGG